MADSSFLSDLGGTLLYGVRAAIDGEAAQRYPQTGGRVTTQDRDGNLTFAGTPFADTLSDVVRNPLNWVGIAAVIVLGVVLVRRL